MEQKILFDAEVKALEDGKFEVIASTSQVDRMGDVIKPDGWVLTNFKKNPVMLWAHDHFTPSVAKATRVWVEDNKLKAKGEFAPTEFAQQLKTLMQEGFLNTVSVGFMPLIEDEKGSIEVEGKMYRRLTNEEIKKGLYKQDGFVFDKQELLEISWVNVPALPQALVTSRKMGLDLMVKALENKQKDSFDLIYKKFEKDLLKLENHITQMSKAIIALTEWRESFTEKGDNSSKQSNLKGRKNGLLKRRKNNPYLQQLRLLDKLIETFIRKQKNENKKRH